MSAIARYFISRGIVVAGYDKTPSELTRQLEREGMLVHYEENVDEIPHACKKPQSCLVVYTPAVPADHKELQYFRKGGFEIQKRAQVLGTLTRSHRAPLRSRNTRKDYHIHNVCAHHAPKCSRLQRLSWRHIQELRHKLYTQPERICSDRGRRVRPLFPLAHTMDKRNHSH